MNQAAPGFAHIMDQIAALGTAEPAEARAGHRDLGPGLWLSTDPGGRAVMAAAPGERGFRLTLEEGDSGRWAALGMRLEPARLEGARYFALLLRASTEGTLAFTPALRYHFGEDFTDAAAAPVVLSGPDRESLSHVPVDAALLARSRACECNLFFSTDRLSAGIHLLEPLVVF